MNVIDNIIFIGMLLIFCIAFSILMSALGLAMGVFAGYMNDIYDYSWLERVSNSWDDMNSLLQLCFQFIVTFLVAFSLLSSSLDRRNLEQYVTTFIVALLVGSFVAFSFSQLATNLIAGVPGWVEWDYLPAWFVGNWTTILALNIIAYLTGFVFVYIRSYTNTKRRSAYA